MTSPRRGATIERSSPWPLVLALVGLDYFSTLAYLPSIAVEAAGPLAPMAVLLVVVVTFLLALPVYCYVIGRSPHGHGATALVEQTCPGWRGKILVLTLLGFAAADFVITRSLSVADAATHLIHNPHGQALLARARPWADWLLGGLGESAAERAAAWVTPQMVITLGLSILTFAFWWQLRAGITHRMLVVATLVVLAYLALSGLLICGRWPTSCATRPSGRLGATRCWSRRRRARRPGTWWPAAGWGWRSGAFRKWRWD